MTPTGTEHASFSRGLTAILSHQAPALGHPTAHTLGLVVANLSCLVLVLGVAGITGAPAWARRRRRTGGRLTRGLGTVAGLGWPLVAMGLVVATPTLVGELFGGRDVTWLTAWYGWSSLVILLALTAAVSLATLVLRVAYLVVDLRRTHAP